MSDDTEDGWRPSCYDCGREMSRRNLQPTPVHIHHDDEPGYDRVNVPMCHACRLKRFPTHECEYCGEEYLDITDAVECCQHRRGRPMPDGGETDEWTYDAYRVGRTTRTVTVDSADGPHTIEEGTIRFEPINAEDTWMWEEESWVDHLFAPDADGLKGNGLEGMVHLPHEKLGIIEFPEPMTEEEAGEWLEDNPEQWRQFVDDELESDTTAADLLEEVR